MQTRLLRALALAVGLAAASPAGAQSPWGWGQPGYNVSRSAYENGYRDGVRAGERDARSGQRYDVDDNGLYRDADRGYDGRYGSRGQYRQTYRRGFEQGYRDAYQGRGGRATSRYPNDGRYSDYGRGPRGYGYYSPASDKGYADGYEKGLDDGRDRDRFDPVGEKWYREGDRGYEREYGSRDAYKNRYRDAFRQGYERGYQDGSRGRRDSRGIWPF
jgi:hypothetical protein